MNHNENFVSRPQRHCDEPEDGESVSDEAEDWEDISLLDDTVVIHTNKIERAWGENKRGLIYQPIHLLSRNIGVEMFMYNHLNVKIPFEKRRDLVLQTVAKHQTKIDELLRESYSVYPEE